MEQETTVIEGVEAAEGVEATEQATTRKKQESEWKKRWKKDWQRDWRLYLLFIPVVVFFIMFNYIPMFGVVIAFEDFKPGRGVFHSEWIGWENFVNLFTNDAFPLVFRNTCMMALMNLTIGFACLVILGLLISQVRVRWFKRSIQTISYMPYFVATVVVFSLLKDFLSDSGVITEILVKFGAEREDMLTNPKYYWWINTFADVWQGAGYGAIVFVAAISNINPDLNEAVALDGAGRWARVWHITVPSIVPTIITMFTLRVGLVFTTGFDKVLLLYNESIYETADCLSTFTYRYGVALNDYGLSSAAGLFQAVIATALLLFSNKLTKIAAKTSLF